MYLYCLWREIIRKCFSPVHPSWSIKLKCLPTYKANWDTVINQHRCSQSQCRVVLLPGEHSLRLNAFRFLLNRSYVRVHMAHLWESFVLFKVDSCPKSCRMNGEPALRWSGKVCLSFSIQPPPHPPRLYTLNSFQLCFWWKDLVSYVLCSQQQLLLDLPILLHNRGERTSISVHLCAGSLLSFFCSLCPLMRV